jgi:hypothetical protein
MINVEELLLDFFAAARTASWRDTTVWMLEKLKTWTGSM